MDCKCVIAKPGILIILHMFRTYLVFPFLSSHCIRISRLRKSALCATDGNWAFRHFWLPCSICDVGIATSIFTLHSVSAYPPPSRMMFDIHLDANVFCKLHARWGSRATRAGTLCPHSHHNSLVLADVKYDGVRALSAMGKRVIPVRYWPILQCTLDATPPELSGYSIYASCDSAFDVREMRI